MSLLRFGATGLAGQGVGRLSGLQRGLTSLAMWLSRVNVAFVNVPFAASALRALEASHKHTHRRNQMVTASDYGPGRLYTNKFN